jgi:hypothetical protein
LICQIKTSITDKIAQKIFYINYCVNFGKILALQRCNNIVNLKLNIMDIQKILVGAFAGLIAGAVIGILAAPASGNETRQKITGSANNLKRRFRRLAGKAEKEIDGIETTLS